MSFPNDVTLYSDVISEKLVFVPSTYFGLIHPLLSKCTAALLLLAKLVYWILLTFFQIQVFRIHGKINNLTLQSWADLGNENSNSYTRRRQNSQIDMVCCAHVSLYPLRSTVPYIQQLLVLWLVRCSADTAHQEMR